MGGKGIVYVSAEIKRGAPVYSFVARGNGGNYSGQGRKLSKSALLQKLKVNCHLYHVEFPESDGVGKSFEQEVIKVLRSH